MHGRVWPSRPVRQVKSRRNAQFRRGQRRAVLRALTGARILLGLPIEASSQAGVAELVGSNIRYVEAGIAVLQAEDPALVTDVLAGRKRLLDAAAKVRRRADLIAAYRRATLEDRAAVGPTIGVEQVFDEMIAPSL
jgi:hypothetical protein